MEDEDPDCGLDENRGERGGGDATKDGRVDTNECAFSDTGSGI